MAKYSNPAALDLQLAYYAGSTRMTLCSAIPANFAGIAAVALTGPVAPTFTGPSAGSPDGRQISVDAKSGVVVTGAGTQTATHVAIDDGAVLRFVDDYTGVAVTNAGTVNIAAWTITVRAVA